MMLATRSTRSQPQGWQQGMAAAISETQSVAATPGGTQQPQVPTGSTPNAKRPLDRASIQVAQTGSRVMSQEDLSAGLYHLQRLQQRDEQHLASTADAVHHNSPLLNAVVGRLNSLEAVTKLTTDSMNGMGTEIKDAFNMAEKLGSRRSTRRPEL